MVIDRVVPRMPEVSLYHVVKRKLFILRMWCSSFFFFFFFVKCYSCTICFASEAKNNLIIRCNQLLLCQLKKQCYLTLYFYSIFILTLHSNKSIAMWQQFFAILKKDTDELNIVNRSKNVCRRSALCRIIVVSHYWVSYL